MTDQKKASIQQEERVARLFNGKRTPQSGGGKFVLGDVISEDFLVECKTSVTVKDSYSVKREILKKADEQRREMGKELYALAFSFGDEEDFFVLNKKAMSRFLYLQQEAAKYGF